MKAFFLFLFVSTVLIGNNNYLNANHHSSTCTGSSNCRACTSCNYCKYCNSGGTCSVCAPPPSTKKKSITPSQPSKDYQCKAITKKGTRCSRSATNNGYCWQHAK